LLLLSLCFRIDWLVGWLAGWLASELLFVDVVADDDGGGGMFCSLVD